LIEFAPPRQLRRSALNHVLNKRSWLAALVGTTFGAGALYLLQSIPLIALIPFPFAGTVSVVCYGFALRQSVSIAAGVVLGLQTGILMSVLVIIWTIIVTGVGHYEFAAAVFYAPFIICILSVLGASVTAFFVQRPV
jgi:uncharacterized integral membrane protein